MIDQEEINNNFDEKKSHLSNNVSECNSKNYSELSSSKGYIFENPDGTVVHGFISYIRNLKFE